MAKWRDQVREEMKRGGTESPCPFCHVARVKRSDYVRCCACGINWLEGEALDRDPRRERQARFNEAAQATMSTGKKKEDQHAGR